jgi:hypothetical protein
MEFISPGNMSQVFQRSAHAELVTNLVPAAARKLAGEQAHAHILQFWPLEPPQRDPANRVRSLQNRKGGMGGQGKGLEKGRAPCQQH